MNHIFNSRTYKNGKTIYLISEPISSIDLFSKRIIGTEDKLITQAHIYMNAQFSWPGTGTSAIELIGSEIK
jgi:hypothetical protein